MLQMMNSNQAQGSVLRSIPTAVKPLGAVALSSPVLCLSSTASCLVVGECGPKLDPQQEPQGVLLKRLFLLGTIHECLIKNLWFSLLMKPGAFGPRLLCLQGTEPCLITIRVFLRQKRDISANAVCLLQKKLQFLRVNAFA